MSDDSAALTTLYGTRLARRSTRLSAHLESHPAGPLHVKISVLFAASLLGVEHKGGATALELKREALSGHILPVDFILGVVLGCVDVGRQDGRGEEGRKGREL